MYTYKFISSNYVKVIEIEAKIHNKRLKCLYITISLGLYFKLPYYAIFVPRHNKYLVGER